MELMKKWFMDNSSDAFLTEKFGPTLLEIEQNKKEYWLNDHDGRLAYIILCDQLSRNIYRKSGRAFSNDARGLHVAKKLIDCKE